VSDVWTFRPGTVDRLIFNDVVGRNEYRLPDQFAPADVVIDVGAHIGAFAHAALQRGCRQVWSFEPDRDNCRLAAAHLRPAIDAGWLRLSQQAVWRSDRDDEQLRFDGYHPFPASFIGMEGLINTGNGSVLWGIGEPVDKVSLDAVIDAVTGGEHAGGEHAGGEDRRVRLLKLDCEGAEWPILLTSTRLQRIDEIVGEFHELGAGALEIGEERPRTPLVFSSDRVAAFTIDELSRWLGEAGFRVTHRRHRRPDGAPEGLGMFFAVRDRAASQSVGESGESPAAR
jgi:FkbM family methyltransferase